MRDISSKLRKEARNHTIQGIIAVFIYCALFVWAIAFSFSLFDSLATSGEHVLWSIWMLMLIPFAFLATREFINDITDEVDAHNTRAANYKASVTQKEAADVAYRRWLDNSIKDA